MNSKKTIFIFYLSFYYTKKRLTNSIDWEEIRFPNNLFWLQVSFCECFRQHLMVIVVNLDKV